jgi:hypothetical protein
MPAVTLGSDEPEFPSPPDRLKSGNSKEFVP